MCLCVCVCVFRGSERGQVSTALCICKQIQGAVAVWSCRLTKVRDMRFQHWLTLVVHIYVHLFFKLHFIYMCMCVCVCAWITVFEQYQRTTCRIWFPSWIMWVLDIKLRYSGLVAGTFKSWAILPFYFIYRCYYFASSFQASKGKYMTY